MSEILLLTTAPYGEQNDRAKEIERELSDSLGITAEVVGLFRGKAPHGKALPRRILKKQIAAALPDLEALLHSRPRALCCMHYTAAIAACEAMRRGGPCIPVYVSLRDRALLAPGIAAGVLPADLSELAALLSAQPSALPQTPAAQGSDRETARRISRALKFAAKQEKLIRKYPILTEEHLEWEL